jgi:glycosyltransferase involved in cell wall biosynthesis
MKKENLLFFGELPGSQSHGVSLSNKINLDQLKLRFNIVVSEEVTNLNNFSSVNFLAVRFFIANFLRFLINLIKSRFMVFYLTLYISRFGIIKNIVVVFFFKIFNPNSNIFIHVHRSDLNLFLKSSINEALFKILNLFQIRYIVLSKNQQRYFNDIGIHDVFVLYNTIVPVDARNLYKVDTNEKSSIKILYLSNYIIDKGILDLLELFNLKYRGSRVFLECYGNFTNQLSQSKLVEIVGDNPNISINGPIYNLEKYQKLFNSDVVILPSYNEGVPLIMLESFALGKPIIISSIGYVGEILGDDYPFYCEAGNLDSMFLAIQKYIDNILFYSNSMFFQDIYNPYSYHNHQRQLFNIFNI